MIAADRPVRLAPTITVLHERVAVVKPSKIWRHIRASSIKTQHVHFLTQFSLTQFSFVIINVKQRAAAAALAALAAALVGVLGMGALLIVGSYKSET